MSFSQKIRMQVHSKYDGHCSYCGKEIAIKEMQIDHQAPKRHWRNIVRRSGGEIVDESDRMENLFPACRSCNHYKRALDLDGFRHLMLTLHDRIHADYISKVALSYGIIDIHPFGGKFYFETQPNIYGG